jgi:putative hydrolase of the HAD superfamily
MIFFDLDGTLLDHDYAAQQGVTTLYRIYGSDIQSNEEEFLASWESLLETYFNQYLEGKLSFVEQRRIRMKQQFHTFGITLEDEQADQRFNQYLQGYELHWRCYEDVQNCLDRLGANHHRLGIITNGDHKQQVKKLNHLDILSYFSIVVTSGDVGYSKPSKEIFIEACKRAGVEVSDSYYVGDRLDVDARGSKEAGMKGIWLNRDNKMDENANVLTIHSLDELPDLVGVASRTSHE